MLCNATCMQPGCNRVVALRYPTEHSANFTTATVHLIYVTLQCLSHFLLACWKQCIDTGMHIHNDVHTLDYYIIALHYVTCIIHAFRKFDWDGGSLQ